MANMGHCRFENTAKDLDDCKDYMADNLSETERKSRQDLIDICVDIACEHGYLIGRQVEEIS
jgi:hypothetical protein